MNNLTTQAAPAAPAAPEKEIPKWVSTLRKDVEIKKKIVDIFRGIIDDPSEAERYYNRLTIAAVRQVAKNPKMMSIVNVDKGKSLLDAVLETASLGLEIAPVYRHAWMIPRYNKNLGREEITWQMGWQGWWYLVQRQFNITSYSVVPLYEIDFKNQTFSWKIVNNRKVINHDVAATMFLPENPDGSDPRGKIVGIYVILVIKELGEFAEIARFSDLYKAAELAKGKNADMSFWNKFRFQMMRKTVIAQICKSLPLGGSRKLSETLLDHDVLESTCVNITGTREEEENWDDDCIIIPEDCLTQEGVENATVLQD